MTVHLARWLPWSKMSSWLSGFQVCFFSYFCLTSTYMDEFNVSAHVMNKYLIFITALFLKVIVHSSHFLNHDWYFSLEFSGLVHFFFLDEFSYKIYFADVLIPAFVFCSCVIGLGLVALAATQCGKRKYVLCEWFWHHCYGSSCEFLFLVKIIHVVFVM